MTNIDKIISEILREMLDESYKFEPNTGGLHSPVSSPMHTMTQLKSSEEDENNVMPNYQVTTDNSVKKTRRNKEHYANRNRGNAPVFIQGSKI